ncbi:Asp-tRNA(Asn)/Glu-tRNA(Gln) amidotransferase subunit GatC [Candidatus Lariskella endosymbiont of Epinotia ramella]|uniref:Asp-tRNA(Asn)/Glu-tRNA(Gln) amidotransferase subunit GatC n=1 Tax=Candidatus Lariskella endosymbiont of Epinotia ramella TaxID=3066224 RepID=UPI0030D3D27C
MTITLEDVNKIAKLVHITLSHDEAVSYQRELSSIFKMAQKLNEVDVEGIEPLVNTISNTLTARDDTAQQLDILHKIISNAPDAKYGCFAVPKVVE